MSEPTPLSLAFPPDLHVLIEHQTWARVLPDGRVRVGITSLGVALSGEIYMCRAKSVGQAVNQGQSIAVVELAKSIVSVKSPVTGSVVATNPALSAEPERVHLHPYGDGWIAELTPSDLAADLARCLHGPAVGPAMVEHARLHRIDLTLLEG